MLISEIAEKSGVSIHTLRYYEKIGLLNTVKRNISGRRIYSTSDLEWLVWIKRLKSTGMPLADMKAFAKYRTQGDCTLKQRQNMLSEHGEKLKTEIERLQQELSIVDYKVSEYSKKMLELE